VISAADAEREVKERRSWPYIAPFVALLLLMLLSDAFSLDAGLAYPLRTAVVCGVLLWCSRSLVRLRPLRATPSIALGLLVFAAWIAPDLLWPAYRQHWLFHNSLFASAGPAGGSWLFLVFRVAGSVLLIPIVEELFWRAWLMRWLISPDFHRLPLGAWTPASFVLSAVLFASEHGAYWDVGLIAGIGYNWWMVRTRSLADCILAHTVTNASLAIYVLVTGGWGYWT
jgi:CAAX prenyl protease-like protein